MSHRNSEEGQKRNQWKKLGDGNHLNPRTTARNFLIVLVFLSSAAVAGFAVQEESGACLPEHHMAEQKGRLYCQCTAMGGYLNCDDKTGHYSYQKWVQENQRREQDIDPKTKTQREKSVPMCRMSCKEDQCECCAYMSQFRDKRKAQITIPYDNY